MQVFYSIPEGVSRETYFEMTEEVLKHARTPYDRLYEYPYRDDTSDQYVKNAQSVVNSIIDLYSRG